MRFFFFFKQKTAYEIGVRLVGSEMCIRDRFNPKYDKQEDIYNAFFLELEDAVNKIDPTKDKVTGDLIYAGDVTKWQQLANSLRLRFAMRISSVCLLYTSDAADEEDSVDLGGRRII